MSQQIPEGTLVVVADGGSARVNGGDHRVIGTVVTWPLSVDPRTTR